MRLALTVTAFTAVAVIVAAFVATCDGRDPPGRDALSLRGTDAGGSEAYSPRMTTSGPQRGTVRARVRASRPPAEGQVACDILVEEERDDPLADSIPLPGAHVRLRDAAGAEHEATSGADGRAHFTGLSPGRVQVRSTAPGHVASDWREWEPPLGVDILERAVGLDGRVVDAEGRGVAGAEVLVAGGEPIWGSSETETIWFAPLIPAEGFGHARVTTDADGRFHADCVPPKRSVAVYARTAGLGPSQTAIVTHALGTQGTEVVLVVEPTWALTGRALDADGKPAAGAVVCVVDESNTQMTETVAQGGVPWHDAWVEDVLAAHTGADGAFRVEGLRFGRTYTAIAVRGDRAPSEAARHLASTPGAAPPPRVELKLRGRASVTIRVLGPDGKPAADSDAHVLGAWSGGGNVPGSGVHQYSGLIPGRQGFRAWSKECPPEYAEADIAAGGANEVVIRLHTGVAWEVVVDAAGRPVEGATVRAWHDDGRGWWDSNAQGTTDAEGRVRFTGLRAGPHVGDAVAPGLARQKFDADVGERSPPGRVVLCAGGVLRGVVRDADGKPVRTVVRAAGPVAESAASGDDGRFEMHVPPGRYELTRWDSAAARAAADVTDGAKVDVDLR